MGLRDINLDAPLNKVTEDSERSVDPAVTYQTAIRALARKGIAPEFQVRDFDGVFWIADCDTLFRAHFPEFDYDLRIGGKGPSRDQCLASAVMEFVERYSLHTANVFQKREFECLDLRDGSILRLGPILEMRNTMCVAAGNNYEEAILHCLHELLETRLPRTSLWKPFKTVPLGTLFPGFPEWVERSILLVLSPIDAGGFYHFTAVMYPFNGAFDEPIGYRLMRDGQRLVFKPSKLRSPKRHSPNSGGAAGLNPRKTAFRAMNEIFQFQKGLSELPDGKRRPMPEYVPIAGLSELPNLESRSITEDIRIILDILGDETFVGVVDFTDPEIGMPVVKLISDYAPSRSLVSRETLGMFFEL